ncbi:hypothetical protein E2C01_064186 [Portunus trituberculatus]|uniref:Uncharacterized protein n=1 Tax=Portunus trituberculatus TaxID=210409 RepID=A0A5B7HIE3_PORTR|nr:hypothetical protein [Portunus trituberculatus]
MATSTHTLTPPMTRSSRLTPHSLEPSAGIMARNSNITTASTPHPHTTSPRHSASFHSPPPGAKAGQGDTHTRQTPNYYYT